MMKLFGGFVGLLGVVLILVLIKNDVEEAEASSVSKNTSDRPYKTASKDCHYNKGAWTECDSKNNTRTKTLTLKKGDESKCDKVKVFEKKCKQNCKYRKGTWGKCNTEDKMVRVDTLRNSMKADSSCEKTKTVTRKCKNKTTRPLKSGRGNKSSKKNKSQEHSGTTEDLFVNGE